LQKRFTFDTFANVFRFMIATAETYQQNFEASLASLNDTQRLAVEQIDGPVLVLAGPGTGKTHILAARIGNILTKTDTQPHNLLCLTFTDAGASAMRQRLLQLIGPEAHKIHIFTYHAFCNHIIKSNAEFFRINDLELISELEQIGVVRNLLEDLPADHILIEGRSDFFYEKHLLDIFEKIKKENWTVGQVKKAIKDYLADLPSRAEYTYKVSKGAYKKGDLKKDDFLKEELKMKRLAAAVELFEPYSTALINLKRYDYADMISWVIETFEKNENLLRNYQEQYLYFLVDEFQDTNGAQHAILDKLVTYWENPNVFIVGDDDQAIYEFQGAQIKSFNDFYKKYQQDIAVFVLRQNYRSTQNILDAAKNLIDNNNLRIINELSSLGVDKNLVATNDKIADSPIKTNIVAYKNTLHELSDVVEKLKKASLAGEKMSDYAILYAQHKQGEPYIDLLEKNGIPYTTQRPINVLETTVVQQVILLLQYISMEVEAPSSGDDLLFKILHLRCWQIPVPTIAAFSIAARKERVANWREAASNHEFLTQNNIQNVEELVETIRFLEACIGEALDLTVPQLVEKIINQSGILTKALLQDNATQTVDLLHTFFHFTKKENSKYSIFSLKKFVDTLEKMEKNRIRLPLQRNIEHENGVVLSTIHSAKGLEYKHVFIIDNLDTHWEKRRKNVQNTFALPDTLTLTGSENETETQRRLFYVGMTRAKETLQISYGETTEEGKTATRSQFIEELLTNTKAIDFIEQKYDLEAVTKNAILLLRSVKPTLPPTDHLLIDKKLEKFELTASTLNVFLDCPLHFYYQYMLNVPSQSSEYANYGNVLHKTLQVFFNKSVFANKKNLLPATDLIAIFEESMQQRKYDFTKKAYKNRLEIGKKHLADYYEKEIATWSLEGQVEVRITNTHIDGVPVNGNIDKIIFEKDGTVQIIDYKTGKFKQEKISKSKEEEKIGGDYRKQLIFYKLLYENWRNTTRAVSSLTVAYLDPDAQNNFLTKNIDTTSDEIAAFRQLLKTTYERIMRHDFYEGCGKKDCDWCHFVQHHVLPAHRNNTIAEETDDV
jgi:DNA helicase II / ATP-dependent DNA helicase PcrA